MNAQRVFAATAALLISATLVDTAAAYPTTARSGTTTVTGTYRPLELNLSLSDGLEALNCEPCIGEGEGGGGEVSIANTVSAVGSHAYSYSATYNGTYTGIGYNASGASGNWRLELYSDCGSPGGGEAGDTIVIRRCGVDSTPVGRLTYLGGGKYNGVPYADTPQVDDFFELFTTDVYDPDFLKVTCLDGVATCATFVIKLLQNLKHLGPYVPSEGGGGVLDTSSGPSGTGRVNADCSIDTPCGTVPSDKFFGVSSSDACKNNGWRSLSRPNGSPFKNQGDCVSWANTGK